MNTPVQIIPWRRMGARCGSRGGGGGWDAGLPIITSRFLNALLNVEQPPAARAADTAAARLKRRRFIPEMKIPRGRRAGF
jgi:hypothetical protein